MAGPVEQFRNLIAAAPIEIAKTVDKVMDDLNARGILLSGIAIKDISESWMKETETALLNCLDRIASQKPRQKDWDKIEAEAVSFVDSQVAVLRNRLRTMYREEHAGLAEPEIQTRKDAVITRVKAYVAGQKTPSRERVFALMWDLVKVVAGAIIGSLATWILSNRTR